MWSRRIEDLGFTHRIVKIILTRRKDNEKKGDEGGIPTSLLSLFKFFVVNNLLYYYV